MDIFALKVIAIVAMLLDHVAAVFFTRKSQQYMIMREIGRIAFPIFCFCIVEGFFHTRNVKKYMIRLACFALISEIPFNLCFYHNVFCLEHQNVFFTLLIGLVAIYAIEEVKKHFFFFDIKAILLQFIIIGLSMTVAWFLRTDYSMLGVLIIMAFYFYRGNILYIAISILVATLYLGNKVQLYSLLALIPILLYNGKKGPSMRYVFYVFYPAHMLVLYAVSVSL
ncbi:TraX family protein [Anaerosporobacter sp.]|uniref:TraX family protein n=1 Tax=Anaerosporobacter sp. TaxID=1872529 RepID=UPI00286F0AE4|nr:TraX family protein [Anaerosporobacter sp.]